ncbi:penicillin acylase family protein [Kribbella sandramycini]|uniref:Penicillin acylase family protein n=1 Tax=Kribbella sandramycini TaxID=60450 RepID=A0A7Y4NZ42_9ACTN|nr:penicillin amidase [Kribbella sandramycini]NOL39604.1 penicillin acylase family protein [Kribbella sandramycini]
MNPQLHRDAYGVPHLQAGDPLALVHLQGATTARDRAWQLEYARHHFNGTTAAFLGPDAVPWDTFARQARIADTARLCFGALDPATAEWVTAYVAGVNSALPTAEAPEFVETGLTPGKWEPWTPLGIWLAMHILFAGFPGKLWRTHVAQRLGEEYLELFTAEGPTASGSNGWLVPGSWTSTGQPIIAGDPHRFVEHPGVYQQIRLACPEYDVLGLAVPGIPGLAHFGHTGKVAWAITNSAADYQDLYAEQLRRTGSSVEALGPSGWAPATLHTEVVEAAGADPVTIEVIETERGPVIIDQAGQTVSLRHPPRVLHRLGFEVLPRLLQATTVADVDAALADWVEPVNVVMAADTDGGLLHRVAGAVPRRDRANMLRVVPAWDATFAWDGWMPMPSEEVTGPISMGNAREISAPLGVEFAPPHRTRRIRELLLERSDWSVDEMATIHSDTYLASVGSILDLLLGLLGLSPEAVVVRKELFAWDRRMDATSTTASTYVALRKAIAGRFADRFSTLESSDTPELFAPFMDVYTRTTYALENLLASADLDVVPIVRAALEEVAAAEPRPPWGETHQLTPYHPLRTPLFTPAENPIDLPLGGDRDCVQSTTSIPGPTDLCLQASAARYAWDLADRSASSWVVPLGASGIQGTPHHHDQLPLWLAGHLIPVI